MRFLLYILVVFLLAKEYIIVNEELLVILSFGLLIFILFSSISSILSNSLDEQASEISQQFVVFSQKKLATLAERKNLLSRSLGLREAFLDLTSVFIFSIDNFVESINQILLPAYKAHLENMFFIYLNTEVLLKEAFLQKGVNLTLQTLSMDSEFGQMFEAVFVSSENSRGFILDQLTLDTLLCIK